VTIRLAKADELDPALYPDVVRARGLGPCIAEVLQRIGSALRVAPSTDFPVAHARVEGGQRFSQIYIGAAGRIFTTDFWSRGVCLAPFATPEIEDLVRAIDFWIGDLPTTRELVSRFPGVDVSPGAVHFEDGTEVEAAWTSYLARSPYPELEAFIREAATVPELRQLYPFTSLKRLCFSRCTGYPYTFDCPVIVPTRDGRYVVKPRRDLGWEDETASSAPVDAKEAVRLAVSALPQGAGPARPGTAEDP
jgi:hypothetical protein